MPEPTIHEQLDSTLDEVLLSALQDEPTAALMNVCRQRLKDLGFTKVPEDEDAATVMADALGMEANPDILKMPGLDAESDAATG